MDPFEAGRTGPRGCRSQVQDGARAEQRGQPAFRRLDKSPKLRSYDTISTATGMVASGMSLQLLHNVPSEHDAFFKVVDDIDAVIVRCNPGQINAAGGDQIKFDDSISDLQKKGIQMWRSRFARLPIRALACRTLWTTTSPTRWRPFSRRPRPTGRVFGRGQLVYQAEARELSQEFRRLQLIRRRGAGDGGLRQPRRDTPWPIFLSSV